MPSKKPKVYTCLVQDDEDMYCLREYSERQHKQDGMCGACASKMWAQTSEGVPFGKHEKE